MTDGKAIAALQAKGVKVGDAFDMEIGGLADESAGDPVRVTGKVLAVSPGPSAKAAQTWIFVGFGRGNVLVISPFLAQIIELSTLRAIGLEPAEFDVIAIKSRVHFRRGFDDSGFAKTILLVEPDAAVPGNGAAGRVGIRECRPESFLPVRRRVV